MLKENVFLFIASHGLVKNDSMRKSISKEQLTGSSKNTIEAPNLPSDPAKICVEPQNNNSPKEASEEVAMQNSLLVPKLNGSPLHASVSSLIKIFPKASLDRFSHSLCYRNDIECWKCSKTNDNNAFMLINNSIT